MTDFPPYLPVAWCSRTGLLAVKEPGTGRMFKLVPSRNSPGTFEVLPEHEKPESGAKTERPKAGPPARSPFAVIDGGKEDG